MTEEAGVGNQDNDEKVCDQRGAPCRNVVRTKGKVWVLFVRFDGLGGQKEEDPDAGESLVHDQMWTRRKTNLEPRTMVFERMTKRSMRV